MTVEPLAAADDRSFDELYRIYAEAIAVTEQKPREQVAAMAIRPEYEVLLARSDGRVVGFSILFLPAREPFCLLEYMAVDAGHRSGGVGAALFRHGLRIDRITILEVDSDRAPSPEPPEQDPCRRRQAFYRRLGCRRVEGLSYVLPLEAHGAPPEMDLLVHAPPDVESLPKLRLERWLKVVYQEVYGCPPGDLRIRRMLEPVADPARLV